MTQVVNQRLQSFGRFLQTHQFREPLDWEVIEAVVLTLEPSRTMKEILRICLLTLGHLLAARGEIESREALLERRRSLAPIEPAPEAIQPVWAAISPGSRSERQLHPTYINTWSPWSPSGRGAKGGEYEHTRWCSRPSLMTTS